MLARSYVQALETAGHTVAHAVSAQTAVHMADQCCPDAVVLELQLPRHNGVEFLYEFRSYSEWLHIPIVIQSFVPPHEYNLGSTLHSELGVVAMLHKPTTSLRQLVRAIAVVQPTARP